MECRYTDHHVCFLLVSLNPEPYPVSRLWLLLLLPQQYYTQRKFVGRADHSTRGIESA